MRGLADAIKAVNVGDSSMHFGEKKQQHANATPHSPVKRETLLEPPSMMARYTCASIMVAIFAIWGKCTFVGEAQSPGVTTEVHSYKTPLMLTAGYLVSLQILKILSREYLSKRVDVKLLLTESMILYNLGQVALNAWMVYRFLSSLYQGHPFVGDIHATGATYAVWVHYCDKYLEFFDTYFMVLRGKMDQVSFLHIYHHATIAWAWWAGITFWPGGDAYFGALLNSWIHVMMYSYYALSLLKISCPWKRYLTQAQLLQFATVLGYSGFSFFHLPQEANWKHFSALIIQDAEMISLFILFMHFYNKAYNNKRKISAKKEPEISEGDASTDAAATASVSSASITDAGTEETYVTLTSKNREVDVNTNKNRKKMKRCYDSEASTDDATDTATEQASVSSDITTDASNEPASIASSASTDDEDESVRV